MNCNFHLKCLLISAGLIYCVGLRAQSSKISVVINPLLIANVGRSYGVNLQYDINNRFRFYLGCKYHQNLLVDPRFDGQKFRHRFYANTTAQHIGYGLGFNYKIDWPYSAVKPYAYYDLTYFSIGLRTLMFVDVDSSVNTANTKLKKVIPIKYSNLQSFEHNVGVGLICGLTKWLSINTRGGIGANFISNLPDTEYENGRHVALSLQYAVGFQINY